MDLKSESTGENMKGLKDSLDLDEMRTALAEMSLTSITIGEYLVVMNTGWSIRLHTTFC